MHKKDTDMRKVKSASSFGRYLKSFGFEKDKVNDVRTWLGLRLLKDAEEPGDGFSLWTDRHLEGQKKSELRNFYIIQDHLKKRGLSVQVSTKTKQRLLKLSARR